MKRYYLSRQIALSKLIYYFNMVCGMSVTQISFCANILLMISINLAAPVDEPISFIQQYLNQNDDSDGEYYQAHTSNSTNTYRKRKTEEGYISLCWAETLIVTEDKHNNKTTLSKRYSILLESPIDLDRQVIGTNDTACYEIIGNGTNDTRVYNVTTIKETDEYVVKEHKTLFCGAGPVLSEHFIAWPKLNKKQIEISINPLTTSQWRDCNKTDTKTLRDLVATAGNNSRRKTSPATLRSIKRKLPQLEIASGTTETVAAAKDTLGYPEVVGDFPTINRTSEEDGTEGNVPTSLEDGIVSGSLRNFLLKRDVNCSSDLHSELCEELLRHSEIIEDIQSNSGPALVNLFFPNATILDFFRYFGGDNAFNVRGTFILEVKANSSKNDEADEKVISRIVVIEDSMVANSINSTDSEE